GRALNNEDSVLRTQRLHSVVPQKALGSNSASGYDVHQCATISAPLPTTGNQDDSILFSSSVGSQRLMNNSAVNRTNLCCSDLEKGVVLTVNQIWLTVSTKSRLNFWYGHTHSLPLCRQNFFLPQYRRAD